MTLPENNEKLFYRIGEVSKLSGIKAYVLRYWETEFKQIRPQKSRSGQRIYRHNDLETIIEIKKLLYDKGYTIAGARKALGKFKPGKHQANEKEQLKQAISGLKTIKQMLKE